MIKNIKHIAGIFAAISLIASPVFADSSTAPKKMDMKVEMTHGATVTLGDLELSGSFTRAMPPAAKAGGGFVTITNNGTESDRLVSAASGAANMVQLHEMRMENEVMVMREMKDGIEIPAGETVNLKPGGLHIMFMKVKKPFVEGEMVKVTLTFEKAGSVDIMLPVGPMMMKMKH